MTDKVFNWPTIDKAFQWVTNNKALAEQYADQYVAVDDTPRVVDHDSDLGALLRRQDSNLSRLLIHQFGWPRKNNNHDSLFIKFEQLAGLLDSALHLRDTRSDDARKPIEDAIKLVDIIRKMVIK